MTNLFNSCFHQRFLEKLYLHQITAKITLCFTTRKLKVRTLFSNYRISSYSFRGNYSFLNLEVPRSQYIRPKVTVHKGAETIQGRKVIKGGNYMRKYGMVLLRIIWTLNNHLIIWSDSKALPSISSPPPNNSSAIFFKVVFWHNCLQPTTSKYCKLGLLSKLYIPSTINIWKKVGWFLAD